MKHNAGRWIRATVTVCPTRVGESPNPPFLFTGYRNSHVVFDTFAPDDPGCWAVFYVVGRKLLLKGESGEVLMNVFISSLEEMESLRQGATFSYLVGTQTGQPMRAVGTGTITSVGPIHVNESNPIVPDCN